MGKQFIKTMKFVIVCICVMSIVGCARKAPHKKDPFEQINRGVYNFNKAVDNMYVRPVAYAYRKFVPPPIRYSWGNVIQNINEVPTFINDVLQGKPKKAGEAFTRFFVNSTLGVLGIFDVAGELGLKRHSESLANTFVHWGYKESNYFVLPFLGPSTFRDTVGLAGNTLITPTTYLDGNYRTKYYVASLIHKREALLDLQEVVDAASSVDEYAFIRDAYFQKRATLKDVQGEVSEEDEVYLDEPPE